MYDLFIWHDGEIEKVYLGRYSEEFCRAYCKEFAGKVNGLHVSAVKAERRKKDVY